MRISRVRIVNFANFSDLDVETGDGIVVLGENKVGKSNFVLALQLLLDPGLSERDRQLGLEHFWDGLGERKLGAVIEISVELTDFKHDPRLLAHLADCVISPGPPMVARLTYRFQPKAALEREPESPADYEYILFGGENPDMAIGPGLRRMLPLDVLGALRDAEKDLATWRRSPLRPLIEDLTSSLDEDARALIQEQADAVQEGLSGQPAVLAAAVRITDRLNRMVGTKHATSVALGLAPTRVDALLRALRLLIDDRARGVAEASLGTANLIFLALKSLEFDRLIEDRERDHTFLAVEEPEAHLHPHVQRLVYRYFLAGGAGADGGNGLTPKFTTILTTHSPHIASVAPIRSIVLLRRDPATGATTGVSTATAPLTARDEADLQRYIDVTRGELFFARGVVLVEGDAARFLVPAFAAALDLPLDALGISVCSVGGTNFAPYVKLLGPGGLNIPHVVLTDRDPEDGKPPRARRRIEGLLEIVEPGGPYRELADEEIFRRGAHHGYFINGHTLETELFAAGLGEAMMDVLKTESRLSRDTLREVREWLDLPDILNVDRLVMLIERVGKGRFAQLLAAKVEKECCPGYLRHALEYISNAVA